MGVYAYARSSHGRLQRGGGGCGGAPEDRMSCSTMYRYLSADHQSKSVITDPYTSIYTESEIPYLMIITNSTVVTISVISD